VLAFTSNQQFDYLTSPRNANLRNHHSSLRVGSGGLGYDVCRTWYKKQTPTISSYTKITPTRSILFYFQLFYWLCNSNSVYLVQSLA
jgi:hypothetical protein